MPAILTAPNRTAVKHHQDKTLVGSPLTSAQWETLAPEFKLRAFFSARVEDERLLAEMQQRLLQRLQMTKPEDGAHMDRGLFIEEMQKELKAAGYKRPDDVRKGSLRDLKSERRLGLIYDMNLAQATGYARYLGDMTEEGLDNEPCYELVRVFERIEHRLWPKIWREHGGDFFDGPGSNDDYPEAPGRMIALKADPIWTAISRFGVPWPPFDWGSGMGLRSLSREESDAFGITDPTDIIPVPATLPGFNEGHRMSVRAVPEAGRESLRSTFGDAIRFDGDEAVLQRELTSETDEERKEDIEASIRSRASRISDAGRTEIDGLRSGDDASAWASGIEFEELLASTSSVAVGRKSLYHDQWAGLAKNFALLIRSFLPDEVEVYSRAGHVYAWRPDLLRLTLEEIERLTLDDNIGHLLGYGQNLYDLPSASVRFMDDAGNLLGGFRAPLDTASTFARIRAKDFEQALGIKVRALVDGKEVRP